MDEFVLLSFVGATALLAISPGPDNIYVLVQSIVYGVKSGIATVLGLITGCLIHTSLVAFGASAIIAKSDSLYLALKIFGAVYLCYLAIEVYRSSGDLIISSTGVPKKTLKQLFKQGFIMNVLNPKVSIFFLAFFPSFMFSDSLGSVSQFFILGFIFMGVSLLIFLLLAGLAGAIALKIKKNKHIGLWLKWLQIIVFLGLAIFILFSE